MYIANNVQESLEVVAIFKLNSLNNLQLLLLLFPTPSLVITPLLGIPWGRIQPYPCQAQELPPLASAQPSERYLCWQPFQGSLLRCCASCFLGGEKKKTALSPNLDAGSNKTPRMLGGQGFGCPPQILCIYSWRWMKISLSSAPPAGLMSLNWHRHWQSLFSWVQHWEGSLGWPTGNSSCREMSPFPRYPVCYIPAMEKKKKSVGSFCGKI